MELLRSFRCMLHALLAVAFVASTVAAQFGPPGGDDRGRGGRGFGGPPGGGFGGSLMEILRREDTQAELKLTDDQKSQLDGLMTGMRDDPAVQEIFGRMRTAQSDADRSAVFNDLRKHMEGRIQSVLSRDQYTRAQQLSVQRAGARALASDEAAQELKLSEEQQTRIREASEKYDADRRALREDQSLNDQQREARTEELRAARDQAIESVLNDQQRQAWTAKKGAEFTFSPDAGFGGRFGGAGGPGREQRVFGPGARTDSPRRAPLVAPGSVTTSTEPGTPAGESTVSFGATVEPGKKVEKLSFNFRYAPWADVLKLFADAAGLTLDLDEVPPGTFNYYDAREYTPAEALDVLNGYLLKKGYLLVHRDEFLVVLNIDNPIPPNLIPTVELADLPNRGRNELMTVVLPVEGLTATEVAAEIAELLGPQGKAIALNKANKVVVTDIGSNLRRAAELLNSMVVVKGDRIFRQFTLQHIAPVDADIIVRDVVGLPQRGVENVSAGANGGDSRYRYGPPPDPRQQSARVDSAAGKTTVAVDERTSSLLVTATAEDMKLIEDTIKAIDVPPLEGRVTAAQGAPYLEVYQLKSADPLEATKTISVLFPGTVLNEDGRSRRIHIQATPEQHRQIADMIRRLDGEGGGTQMAVLPLGRMDAYTATASIQSLFIADGTAAPIIQPHPTGRSLIIRGSEDQVSQIRVLLTQLDPADGSAMGTGKVRSIPLGGRDPNEFLRAVEEIWNSGSRNPLRVIPLETGTIRARKIPGLNEAVETEPATSRRAPPATEPAPAAGEANVPAPAPPRSQPSASRQATAVFFRTASLQAEEPAANAPAAAPAAPKTAAPRGELDSFFDELDAAVKAAESAESRPARPASAQPSATSPPAAGQPATATAPDAPTPATAEPVPAASEQKPEPAASNSPISVTFSGGNLVVVSQDEAALDRFEELISSMQQSMPPKNQWTVFYLQSADATETAATLERIFPSSSVSRSGTTEGFLGDLSSGLSSMGRGLMDMTGLNTLTAGPQSLRIIPDIRSNSLFVAGPPHLVDEVEDMLKVLDASELPEQLRDRQPRYIAVKNAEVGEVAEIVRNVFSEELEPPQARQQQGNPLAAIMGGGGARGGDQRNPVNRVKLTIGVDYQTSRLIVSCSEPLFQQIEQVVQELDQSALEARKTIRVVQLEHANTSTLKTTLGTLMPRVRVNSSSERRSSGGDSGQSAPQPPSASSSAPSPDQMRQLFMQRMMEQQRGGGGGFPGFGGEGGGRGGDSRRGR